MMLLCYRDLFRHNFSFLYPQKTSENRGFSAGIEMKDGVKISYINVNFDHIWQFYCIYMSAITFLEIIDYNFFWLHFYLVSLWFCISQFFLQFFDFICISLKETIRNALNNKHVVSTGSKTKALSSSNLLARAASKTIHRTIYMQG